MYFEKDREEFEDACRKHAEEAGYDPDVLDFIRDGEGYANPARQAAWWGWREGRANLKSQDREDADRIDFLEAEGGGDFLQIKSGEWIVDTSSRFGMAGDLRSAIDHARRIEGELCPATKA